MPQCPVSGCNHNARNETLEEYGCCSYCRDNGDWIYLMLDLNDGSIKYGRTTRTLLMRSNEHSEVKGGDPIFPLDAFHVKKQDLVRVERRIRELIKEHEIDSLPGHIEWFHPNYQQVIFTIFNQVKKECLMAGIILNNKSTRRTNQLNF